MFVQVSSWQINCLWIQVRVSEREQTDETVNVQSVSKCGGANRGTWQIKWILWWQPNVKLMIYQVLFDIILFIRWSILFINLMKNTPSTIVQRPSAILQHRHSFEQSSSPHLRSFPSPSPPLQPISSVSFSGCLLSSCPVGCTPASAQWCCPLAFWGHVLCVQISSWLFGWWFVLGL